ncbi:transcription repressor NadR [Alicyclobacillus macrosporangiidus]|uniref:transcription repressor NadR n=1 Tax=Alicyclobacillus macrosporangiidus TaxID=392015 RepID=UPI000ABE109A|nr:transcription repressor NadR [Alicyclobacillus macrosporangiidus]
MAVRERGERQQVLLEALRASREPIPGAQLAALCGVTRQVVVHDIALLRAAGEPILSTPRGYWLRPGEPARRSFVLSVCHPPELTETELYTMVDHGLHVVDVVVEHPVYGELRGALHLSSRRDVALFLQRVAETKALLLSSLTEGFHLHTVECRDEGQLHEAVAALRAAGIQVLEGDIAL